MLLDELERLALGTVAVTTRALSETTGPTELTFLGWRVLVLLGLGEESLRLRDIAERLGASAPSTSRLIRRLERRGLVATGPDPTDRRGLRVRLSDDGDRLRMAVLARRRELLAQALADPLSGERDHAITQLADRLAHWI